jgi:S1-C subfamily serine protease
VIGINSQIATGGGQGSVGIGFAVPINTAKQELPKLSAGETIKRAYLGVRMGDVTPELAKQLNLPVDSGALVAQVTSGSPAAKAGMKAGDSTGHGADVIVAVDGKTVNSADDVVNAVAGKQPGDTVEVQYYRGQDKHTVQVTLGARPKQLGSAQEQQQGGGSGGGLPFQLP